jgi:hypothetical protein
MTLRKEYCYLNIFGTLVVSFLAAEGVEDPDLRLEMAEQLFGPDEIYELGPYAE